MLESVTMQTQGHLSPITFPNVTSEFFGGSEMVFLISPFRSMHFSGESVFIGNFVLY